MSTKIFRYEVPVDDEWHHIAGTSPALHVACRQLDVVEFWAMPIPDSPGRSYRVIGTGQPFPGPNVMYAGTALAPGGDLVWHLVAKW